MAKTLTIPQKKELAEMHYRAGLTQANLLAAKVGSTPKTVGKWIKAGKWEKYRLNIPLVKQEQIQKMLNELQELNASIEDRDEGQRFANSKEADIRRKLVADIKDLEGEAGTAERVSVGMAFIKFLGKIDLKVAQEVSVYFDSFIKDRL